MSGLSFVVTALLRNRRTRQQTSDPQAVLVRPAPGTAFENCRTAEQVRQAYETLANELDDRTPEVAEVLHVQTFVTVCAYCPDVHERTADARGAGFDVTHGICGACAARWDDDKTWKGEAS